MFNWINDWKNWRNAVDRNIQTIHGAQQEEPEYDPSAGELFGRIMFSGKKRVTLSEAITAIADYLDIDIETVSNSAVAKKKERKSRKD